MGTMKRVVSISLGSKSRDHKVTVELLGEPVIIERIGTDGDPVEAKRLYEELDGKVDALGVGGASLTISVLDRQYELLAAWKMIENVKHTPVVDGAGFKSIVERRLVQHVEERIGAEILRKTGMITAAVDRFSLALSFEDAGYDMVYADFMFTLGLPIPLRSLASLTRMAHLVVPIVRRLPMSFIYPTGEKEDTTVPKWEKWYRWAQVIAGDNNYIRRHMPEGVKGKIVATNTTTAADVEFYRARGIKYLVTSTPRLEGRSFGTNVMEAVVVALAGKGRKLTAKEMSDHIDRIGLRPGITRLND